MNAEELLNSCESDSTEDKSDLDWLRDWAERIDRWLLAADVEEDDSTWKPTQYSWIVFRPDETAADAIVRLSSSFGPTIERIKEYLQSANERFNAFNALLPLDQCECCEKTGYLDAIGSKRGVLSCPECGWFTQPPYRRAEEFLQVKEQFYESCHDLQRTIELAVESIEKELRPCLPPDVEERLRAAGIQNQPLRLVRQMWWKTDAVPIEDLGGSIWDTPTNDSVKGTLKKANAALATVGERKVLSQSKGSIFWK